MQARHDCFPRALPPARLSAGRADLVSKTAGAPHPVLSELALTRLGGSKQLGRVRQVPSAGMLPA